MKKLLFAWLLAVGLFSVVNAQVFDNIVNYSANTNYPGLDYQPRVLSLSAGNKVYTLSHEIPYAGAIITELSPSGVVTGPARRISESNGSLVFYTGMCFNVAQNELVLVGTAYGGTASEVIVTRYDIGSHVVLGSATVASGSAGAWLEGVAIRSYDDGSGAAKYLVGGTHKACHNGCANMFLAHFDDQLNVLWKGYFTSSAAKDFLFRDMAVNTTSNEVTLMGFKDDVEVVFFKFNYNTHTISSAFGGGNVKSLIYPNILETPPHLLHDIATDEYYFGAGISDLVGRIHVLLAKTDNNFNVGWSNAYADLSGGPSAQIWSPGRLVLSDDFLITSFQTANNSTPDNGIIRVNNVNGLLISAISYNNWGFAALYPVNTNLGSETMMTSENYQWGRIFDGDAFAINNVGCGNYPRVLQRDVAQPSVGFYNFTSTTLGPDASPNMTVSNVSGTVTDCGGGAIGSFKKQPTSIGNTAAIHTASIYPNPSNGRFVLDLGEENVERVEVLDYMGHLLFEVIVTDTKTEVDMSAQAAGVYLIKLIGQEQSNTLPFYKE